MDKESMYTVDRIVDGSYAVLLPDNGEEEDFSLSLRYLPAQVREGDLLEIALDSDGRVKQARVLNKETEARRKKAVNLLEKIKKKNRP
ncbi:hypothetical protein CR205_12190 [Alteribacter lacisalsi]|uniref:DUF3006 domain-containing protein n=1 Tax=Alteribacter lacisalsi TaxID=2045244 RepID=A0A2W0H3R2_9BACI|nr:DUF3006 domain-containing protein [Alteribacter lacisalsi]PYZ96473.1 hypothetical protein CR205_12190 [Alteribacter lacisalsi]